MDLWKLGAAILRYAAPILFKQRQDEVLVEAEEAEDQDQLFANLSHLFLVLALFKV